MVNITADTEMNGPFLQATWPQSPMRIAAQIIERITIKHA
jgi:hypothetical protein